MTARQDKLFFRSKTFWLGVAAVVIGILRFVLDLSFIEDADILLVLTGLLGIFLRFRTGEPIRLK